MSSFHDRIQSIISYFFSPAGICINLTLLLCQEDIVWLECNRFFLGYSEILTKRTSYCRPAKRMPSTNFVIGPDV
jgi:hypothetical protein